MPKITATLIALFAGILLGAYLQQHLSGLILQHQFRAAPPAYPDQDYGYAMNNDRLADGKGEITWPSGDVYKGAFKNGMMHGAGNLTYANGDLYSGEFRYGKLHGKGEWTSADSSDPKHHYTGEWANGKLIAAQGDITIYSPEEIAEYAIYNQAQRLDQTLEGLQPGSDDRIELYTLGIGAYGAEEVFQREIDYLENNFQPRFSSAGHSVWLSNSRRQLQQRPLATLTSIQTALDTIGNRLNPEQDILFFYLTSHGSRDQTISLQQPGLALSDLSAKQLRRMLDDSGIKWRIIVLSACYSGGFIDALKTEYSLIMTAAAADKTSFGCADNSDFTYFGDALFRQALNDTRDFIAAFDTAKTHIGEWEKSQEKTPSDPQIYEGKLIRAKLDAWRQQDTPLPVPPYPPG